MEEEGCYSKHVIKINCVIQRSQLTVETVGLARGSLLLERMAVLAVMAPLRWCGGLKRTAITKEGLQTPHGPAHCASPKPWPIYVSASW